LYIFLYINLRCSKKIGPQWIPDGSLALNDYDIQVKTENGTQTYKLFDHVTVIIQLKRSNEDLHPNSLSFLLVGKVPVASQEANVSSNEEVDYLKELIRVQVFNSLFLYFYTKIKNILINLSQEANKTEENADERIEKGKNIEKSIYSFFQEMTSLGLTPTAQLAISTQN